MKNRYIKPCLIMTGLGILLCAGLLASPFFQELLGQPVGTDSGMAAGIAALMTGLAYFPSFIISLLLALIYQKPKIIYFTPLIGIAAFGVVYVIFTTLI